MDKKKKKKIYLSIAGLICVVIVLTASSFALWQVTKKQTNFNAMVTACLDLTINNESSEITMDYAYPITDSEGLATNGYTFTVTNNCDQAVSYAIGIESINDNSGKQFVGNSYIDLSLDGKLPVAFSTLDAVTSDSGANYTIRETRSLAIRKVPANGTRTHTIRMWLDEDTPLTEQNKTFVSKVTLTGGQGIEAGCYSVNSNGLLYDYDSECGKAAVIPATVNGHNVRTISSNAFKALIPGYIISDWDNTYSSMSSLEKGSCNSESGSQTCKIDFSMVYSDKLEPMYTTGGEGMTQEEIVALLGSLTLDDIYVIIYNNDPSTPQYSHVNDSIDYYIENNLSEISSLVNFDIEDIERYTYGVDTLPNNGEIAYEQFVAADYNSYRSSWRTRDLGFRMAGGDPVLSLAINSLDLSQATHLEEIESRAFSNAPDLNGVSEFPDLRDYPGLTSLTFGSNSREIEIGGAAFSGAQLNNLTIYTSYINPTVQGDELNDLNSATDKTPAYLVMNPFVGSTINNLNIAGVSGHSTYDGLPGLDINSSGYNENNILGWVVFAGSFGGFYANNITFSGNVTTINNVVNLNENWTLTLPDSLTTIGDYAFATYNGSSLSLPNGITSIGYDAFVAYQGTGQSLVIPSSLTEIKARTFTNFAGSSITFNNGLQIIGDKAFWNYNGADITIPSTITSIGGWAFASKTGNININKANGDGITFGQAWARNATVNYIGS